MQQGSVFLFKPWIFILSHFFSDIRNGLERVNIRRNMGMCRVHMWASTSTSSIFKSAITLQVFLIAYFAHAQGTTDNKDLSKFAIHLHSSEKQTTELFSSLTFFAGGRNEIGMEKSPTCKLQRKGQDLLCDTKISFSYFADISQVFLSKYVEKFSFSN